MGKRRKKTPFEFCCEGRLNVRLEGSVLLLSGNLTFGEAAGFTRHVLKHFRRDPGRKLYIDLGDVDSIDSAGVMALYYIQKKLSEKSVVVELQHATPSVADKIRLFYPEEEATVSPPRKPSFFEHIGGRVYHFFSSYVFEFILLAANIFYWGITDIFKRKVRRKGEFVNQAVLIGVNALLIVVFMTFVIGYVIALHSAAQLRLLAPIFSWSTWWFFPF